MMRDEDLAADADADADQVDQPEAQAEVAHEVARALGPAGQPGRADEADPQAEQGGDDVPLGRDRRRWRWPASGPTSCPRWRRRPARRSARRAGRRGTRRRRRPASIQPWRLVCGGTHGVSRKGTSPSAAPGGAAVARARATSGGGRRWHGGGGEPRRAAVVGRLLHPLAGQVAGRDGPGGPRRAARRAEAARRARCRSSARRYRRPIGPGPAGRTATRAK